jgi:hypothetical protein
MPYKEGLNYRAGALGVGTRQLRWYFAQLTAKVTTYSGYRCWGEGGVPLLPSRGGDGWPG